MSPDADDASPSPEPGTEQDSGNMADEKLERASTEESSPSQATNGNGQPVKSNAKDPLRPRRKKARRACFACQRAHLTCGDERPCLRCIKRGLQDQCHDGVRKKAKYLHDAPPEALIPGIQHSYHMNGPHGSQSMPTIAGIATVGPNGLPVSQPGNFYVSSTPAHFPQYGPMNQPGAMGPPLLDDPNMTHDFTNHQNIGTPTQYHSKPSQQVSPVHDLTNVDRPGSLSGSNHHQSFDSAYLDPSDPSLFNFNVSDLNFGNHYGALEFGMLGHMSSGAVNTPDLEAMNQLGHPAHGTVSFDNAGNYTTAYQYNQGFPSWQHIPNTATRHNSSVNIWSTQTPGMEAFAIGEQPASLSGTSPRSQGETFPGHQSANMSPETQFAQVDSPDLLRQSLAQQQARKQAPFPGDLNPDGHRKRRRHNASEIYSTITAPYAYPQGFHALTAYLNKRFSQSTVFRLAKALAKIRPSFISCNKDLDRDDLIFMEKGFQRTLCEYEDFISLCGTPTVICRRTGEIAFASKEFCLVTGWRREVLLGKEPNLNVNIGGSSSGTHTGSSTRGAATPRLTNVTVDPGRPQPVFLAELLDEDSVIQFYETFAELAFGASRTSMIGVPCSISKYRTKEDAGSVPDYHLNDDGKRRPRSEEVKPEPTTRDEAAVPFGEREGRVDCAMCWTIKRDMFDSPSMIVINLLPII